MKTNEIDRFMRNINQYIAQICNSLHIAIAEIPKLASLPSMKYLIDRSRVHFSHQHRVEENKWNLPCFF